MKQWLIRMLVVATGTMCLAAKAEAATILYASTGDSNPSGGGRIYAIDPLGMTVTLVGNTGLSRMGDLSFDGSGVLYAVDGGGTGPSSLYTISLPDATPTFVGTWDPVLGVDGLAFAPDGTLYAAVSDGSRPKETLGRLLAIDPTNATILTNIDLTGSGCDDYVAGLAFAPSGILYGSRGHACTREDDVVTIDLTTGILTPVGGATNVISDIWISADGSIYAGSPTGEIFLVDPISGAKTLIFDTDIRISGLTGFDEPAAVPEPSGLALMAIGLGLLPVVYRRSRTN